MSPGMMVGGYGVLCHLDSLTVTFAYFRTYISGVNLFA